MNGGSRGPVDLPERQSRTARTTEATQKAGNVIKGPDGAVVHEHGQSTKCEAWSPTERKPEKDSAGFFGTAPTIEPFLKVITLVRIRVVISILTTCFCPSRDRYNETMDRYPESLVVKTSGVRNGDARDQQAECYPSAHQNEADPNFLQCTR